MNQVWYTGIFQSEFEIQWYLKWIWKKVFVGNKNYIENSIQRIIDNWNDVYLEQMVDGGNIDNIYIIVILDIIKK